MSCCDGSRSKLAQSVDATPPPAVQQQTPGRPTLVVVRYDGKGTLTGYGTATGRKYRFPPGVEIAVDIRDRPSIRGVPGMQEIRFA